MGRDLRCFAYDRDIGIAKLVACIGDKACGMGQESLRSSATPLRVTRRKMLANIARAECAEHGID